MLRNYLFPLCVLVGWAATPMLSYAEPDAIRFNRDVRGLLSDKCFACHGPDAKTVEGGLRLDLADPQAKPAGAIVPGDADASELVRRIFSDDPDAQMPPPQANKSLSSEEKQVLRRWIAEGAQYEAHWAYTSLERRAPASTVKPQSTNVIDRFINARLASENVEPTAAADRITLLRRLSFDLTGMPPTLEEVEAFERDSSNEAYTKLVNRLLDSPRFGERMAIYWLDLVRYADTVGYHGDQDVSQSPYRDYVIEAFNSNMPYDQFVREQLAGDLLPGATLKQQVASGYNRLNQTTEEGGSQAKEYLAIYFADRVRNVSQVFMGATMGCAQCHDHKFDPYTMRDFYSLGAFFADIEERGVYGARERPPMIRVPSPELQQQLATIDQHISALESQVPKLREQLLSQQTAWEIDTLAKLSEVKESDLVWIEDEQSTGGKSDGEWEFVTTEQGPVHSGTKSRRQLSAGLVQHFFLGAKAKVKIEQATRFYAWVHLDPKNPPSSIMLQFNDGSWDHRAVWGSDDIEYGRKPESWPGYQRLGELPASGKWVRLEVAAADVGLAAGQEVSGMSFTQFGGLAHWDQAGWVVTDRIPDEVVSALQLSQSDRTDAQIKAVQEYYLARSEPMMSHQEQINERKRQRATTEELAPLTVVSKSVEPRVIRILPRGNWLDDSGEIVEPAIPAFLGKLETGGQRATRLDLANWLCRSDNPLTSRTMVNRLWSLLFGRGICTSVDDFGGQGTFPSHPDLLDTLAIDFVDSGWDIKHTLRQIVSSDAYRRSSKPTEYLMEHDPYNDLFARQGRFRIAAEMIRDSALATSGLLVEQIGGASAKPYQPEGYYDQLNFPKRKYVADENSNQYRRGVYAHWQRTFLHPMLKAFDAPSREECTAARSRSNTPLQSLTLLNDPTFVEAARVYAARIMREGGPDTKSRIAWAYRSAISRKPDDAIVIELQKVYEAHLKHYSSKLDDAKLLTSTGITPVVKDLDVAELAAWTSVARVVLNLHETITRY